MTVSDAPVMLADLPATIFALLGIRTDVPGTPAFALGASDQRERRFYYYDRSGLRRGDYFQRLDEFVIRGQARDKRAWTFLRAIFGQAPVTRWAIDLSTVRSGSYLRSGWEYFASVDEPEAFWYVRGPAASLVAPVPADRRAWLTAVVRNRVGRSEVSALVKVDGRAVGRWTFPPAPPNGTTGRWTRHQVEIPQAANRPSEPRIEFEFAVSGGRIDPDTIVAAFRSIAVTDRIETPPGRIEAAPER